MTIEELLKDRYKVIAPYPNSPYKVGDPVVFSNVGNSFHITTTWVRLDGDFVESENWDSIQKLQEFPNIFKKLEWWEDRAIEDMPEYVKCIKTPDQKIMPGDILKPVWNGIGGKTGGHYIFLYTNCFIPSTEAEYTNYINSKQMDSIKDFLPYYLGCDLLLENTLVVKLYGFQNGLPVILNKKTFETAVCNDLSYIKPILRKLSSLTEEEGIPLFGIDKYWDVVTQEGDCKTFTPDAFHYLLKQGFWLFGQEAFQKGLIIEKSKTMQREILFRGQRKSDKYWLYGDLIKKGSRRFIGYEIEKSVEDYGVENSAGAPGWKTEYAYIEAEVIPETVGQYIGMSDKNAIKIFDGDIGEIKTQSGRVERFVVKWGIHRRDMASGWTVDIPGFCFYIDGFPSFPIANNYLNGHDLDIIQIIGTIHTHPELLTTVK